LSKPIIIVLTPTAQLPSEDQLPQDVRALLTISAEDVVRPQNEGSFNADMRGLYRVLGKKLEARQNRTVRETPDTSLPDSGRAALLRQFRELKKPPYPNFEIESLGELEFIAQQSGALNASSLRGLNLEEVGMQYRNMSGARLNRANLQRANLSHA